MKKFIWLPAFLAALFLLLFFVSPAAAGDGDPVSDDEVNKIAGQLYCPICENVPLDVCPTQACANWRELIRKMLEEGKSEDEIKAYFAAQYGWSVLSMPPQEGLNWLIYVLPPLISIGGIAFLLWTVRKSKNKRPQSPRPQPAQQPSVPDEYLSLINRDLNDEDKNG
ncbi:MAG: cytochrome c-type biogenesis protein CcmH [Anaerolineae bacterium]|nr:cytochrome c-type biogenesis protein CcmH [Anaerolineae bacterium]